MAELGENLAERDPERLELLLLHPGDHRLKLVADNQPEAPLTWVTDRLGFGARQVIEIMSLECHASIPLIQLVPSREWYTEFAPAKHMLR